MKRDIEVEVRGLLTKSDFYKTKDFLEVNGVLKDQKRRILIDYSTFLPEEGIRDRKKDIRVRVTNGIPEIIIKLGSWGGSESRQELSFKGAEGSFDTLVQIFGHLGLKKGILAERKTLAYEYKEIEFALVEVPGHSYYFEAERMAHSEDDFVKVEKEILNVCDELGLSVLSKDGFFEYIDVLNKEANDIFNFETSDDDFFEKMHNV